MPSTPYAKNDTRRPVQHAQAAADKPEQPRPKPVPPLGSARTGGSSSPERSAPMVRPNTGQPARAGSSNRVRARLARLGVQRANPYNPVLEPLVGVFRSNDPQIEKATHRPKESANHVPERGHPRPHHHSSDP
ncbi:GTP pyrophosphokinase, partial [Streptomyces sp. NPDC058442]